MRFEGRAASHVGAVREHDEDAAFFACAGGTALAIVADGCGGLCSGRVAADLAIEVVRDAFRNPLPALSATWWRGEHGTALPATERASIERHVAALLESHRASTPGDVAVLNDALADLLASAIAGVTAELAKHVPELDDAWLLLSDGVFKTLDDGAIERLVHVHGAEAGPALVEAGRRRARDNLSAVVVKVAA